MKTTQVYERPENANGGKAFSNACLKSCKRVVAQMRTAKDAIFAQARNTLNVQERMLRLALNEAEALAWETLYPHLVFPDLAAEKVQEVAAWSDHQRSLRREAQSLNF